MTPIDDELRATLHGRADQLTPSPDPLAGIESRARGLRRRRVAASVAGAALAVSAVALALPALRTTGSGPAPDRVAGSPAAAKPGLLDPKHPWAFRGTLSDAARQRITQEWGVRHRGSTITFLFGQTYEPSGVEEAAFVASGPDGDRFGWVENSAVGPAYPFDEPLSAGKGVLAFDLPGDEGVSRLVLVAAPDSRLVATSGTLTPVAPGVAVTTLEKPVDYLVEDSTGEDLDQGRAEPASYDTSPTNLVSWPARGNQDSSLLEPAKKALAPTLPGDGEVLVQVLVTGDTDSGVRYVVGQIWRRGDTLAHSFSYAEGTTGGPQSFIGPTDVGDVFAFLFTGIPGTTTDLLVVVPRPQTGQVLYDNDRTGPFTPVTGQDALGGVVTIDREEGNTDDRLQLLDGDGASYFEGPVYGLLCGSKECG